VSTFPPTTAASGDGSRMEPLGITTRTGARQPCAWVGGSQRRLGLGSSLVPGETRPRPELRPGWSDLAPRHAQGDLARGGHLPGPPGSVGCRGPLGSASSR
jgi:hypothetical protein